MFFFSSSFALFYFRWIYRNNSRKNLEIPKLKSGQSSNNKIRMMRDTSMNIEIYVHTDSEFNINSTLITRISSQKRIFPFSYQTQTWKPYKCYIPLRTMFAQQRTIPVTFFQSTAQGACEAHGIRLPLRTNDTFSLFSLLYLRS